MVAAILFDVDGTIAETEEGHRQAWNAAFAAHGRGWTWDRATYRTLLRVAGGPERLRAFAGPDAIGDEEIARIHREKNALYRAAVAAGAVPLRPGVLALLNFARGAGIRLAIATTTSRGNVLALLEGAIGPHAPGWFEVMACAEDAPAKKPDPQVYAVALERLGLSAQDTVAIEDSRNGVLAASALGIPVVLSPSFYFDHEPREDAVLVLPDLAAMAPEDLIARLTEGQASGTSR